MKITFLTRHDGGLYFGGAEVQALKTASYLRELGVEVEFLTPLLRSVGDIIHAFGMYPYFLTTAEYCIQRRIPYYYVDDIF